MKVVVLTGSVSRNAGGFFTSVRRLSQSLAQVSDAEITVTALKDEYADVDSLTWEPLMPKCFSRRGPVAFGFSPELARHLMQSDCDLLHQHGIWQFISAAALQWQRKAKRPHLISPRGMLDGWALRHSRWKKRVAGFLFENEHLQKASCLHALCESEAQSIRAFGLRNPVAIIPNGIDLPERDGRTPEARTKTSNFWPLNPGSKVLLYLGRIHPKKGLVNLLKAWAAVRRTAVSKQKSGGWVLAIAGWDQGRHEAQLKSLAHELELSFADIRNKKSVIDSHCSVIFLGPQFGDAKAACYTNCDAFILPSFSEGLPMVILEAWAYGKPVFMTSECNLPEGFAANAAIRVEPNVESLAAGLEELFSLSSSDLRSLGVNGRNLVAARFTWPKIASEMKSVYNWLLGGGPRPSCVNTPS